MIIEAGKYYKTRDGRKVGPMEDREWKDGYPWVSRGYYGSYWSFKGKQQEGDASKDIVAEWTDEQGPVVTETVKRIVPGVYGKIAVGNSAFSNRTEVAFAKSDGFVSGVWMVPMTSDELRAAASVLTQLADALEESK